MTDNYPLRAISPEQSTAFFAVMYEAFNSGESPAAVAERELFTFEFDRSAAAFDGDEMVGTSAAYSFSLSVPGGSAAAAGISDIAVAPGYRRRGILSAMMRWQLADAVARGEPVAALFASESGIYRRFGFGCAASHLRCTIYRGEGMLQAPAAAAQPRLRVTEPRQAGAELAAVYAAAAAARPGAPARDDRWWRTRLHDPEGSRGESTAQRCLLAEDAAGPRGYALYSATPVWDADGLPASELSVRELIATDPAATAALWADLLSRDLIGVVRTGIRPADDPLLELLADRRRARATLSDNLWVRIIDLPSAMRQRGYARDVDVVLEVTDEQLPGNAGRWRLTAAGGPAGAVSCEPASAAADVILPAASLGAAYLGGTRLGALATAGQAAELRPGALAELSAALSWDPAPFCPAIF